jgi:lipopolysaccharide transport system permease protein
MKQPVIQYDITPPAKFFSINIDELWRYRDLLYIFVWRDIKVRYKQTALGVAWAILQPLVTMILFTLIFNKLAKIPSENVPYPIFVFAGLLYWDYFSRALTATSNSLIESENIIKKVYFPRLVLPLSTVVTPIIDFFLALTILIGLMAYYRFVPHWEGILLLPVLLIIALFTALGPGLFLAASNVKFRDVRYLLPFFLQILLFATPVIYPISNIPQNYQWIAYLNPLTGVISIARSALFQTTPIDWNLLAISGGMSILFFLIGLTVFQKTQRFFADIL